MVLCEVHQLWEDPRRYASVWNMLDVLTLVVLRIANVSLHGGSTGYSCTVRRACL